MTSHHSLRPFATTGCARLLLLASFPAPAQVVAVTIGGTSPLSAEESKRNRRHCERNHDSWRVGQDQMPQPSRVRRRGTVGPRRVAALPRRAPARLLRVGWTFGLRRPRRHGYEPEDARGTAQAPSTAGDQKNASRRHGRRSCRLGLRNDRHRQREAGLEGERLALDRCPTARSRPRPAHRAGSRYGLASTLSAFTTMAGSPISFGSISVPDASAAATARFTAAQARGLNGYLPIAI